MEIKEFKSYNTMCQLVASNIRDCVKRYSNPVLGLATGSTPIGVYELLSKMRNTHFNNTITFNLDEYRGINHNHRQSYHYFQKNHFPNQSNLHKYDTMIKNTGGIDIQILGIGTNGHIAFNEPGSSRHSATRIVDLTENTINDNSRFFDPLEPIPIQAFTMGMSSIMDAKKIYLMANGKHKKDILEQAMYGDITEDIPASFLQKHKNVEVLYCD
jgi:glucosamine-6-phosphate deaminase